MIEKAAAKGNVCISVDDLCAENKKALEAAGYHVDFRKEYWEFGGDFWIIDWIKKEGSVERKRKRFFM